MRKVAFLSAILMLVFACQEAKHNELIDDDIDQSSVLSIPFELREDNGIYVKVQVNGSESLDFLFDTGANATVIVTSLIGDKVKLEMDAEVENHGADGIQITPMSTGNVLKIEELELSGVELLSIDYQDFGFDGVLGWTAFENKIVEIDYDNQVLLIHESMKTIAQDYTQIKTKMINGVPYIWGSMVVNDKQSSGWYEFDTGSDNTFTLSHKYVVDNGVNCDSMTKTGESISVGSTGVEWKSNDYILPELHLGSIVLENTDISVFDQDPEGVEYNDILGNKLLKKFNAVLDFKEYNIHLKMNASNN